MSATSFIVQYGEHEIAFEPLNPDGVLKGYMYKCPKCPPKRAFNWIDTESGTRHKLELRDGKATITGSLLCPQRCGWHAFITDGVARDA